MNRRISTFALLFAATGLVASAYMVGPAPGAPTPNAATPSAPTATDRTVERPTPSKSASTISTLRPPVPMLASRRSPYVAAEPEDKAAAPDARAKALIEADGYRNVKVLGKGPDGTWRGRALRGTVEVAVSVDADGRVSAN